MALAEQTFEYFVPSVSLMGVGCSKKTGEQAKSLGATSVLIVTDAVLSKLGLAEEIKQQLEGVGVKAFIFDGAEPNPTRKNVEDGLAVYRKNQCDGIVGLGGGSSLDCAKAIGLVAANGGSIFDYVGVDKSKKPTPPFIAINTTAGTASEVTRNLVITDTENRLKLVIADRHTTPTVAINDPTLMVGMPPSLTAATGMDALTHAIEAYVSTGATPITDGCALHSIKLIAQSLPQAVANGKNIEARDLMAYGEFMAGMAFNSAGLGYVHAMAHQLGGLYNLPHGVCNAILLPIVCDFNLIACPEKFADIAAALGEKVDGLSTFEAAKKGVERIRALSASVGIPSGLTQLGVKETDVPQMAENAMKDGCMVTNPRTASLKDVMAMYRTALAADAA